VRGAKRKFGRGRWFAALTPRFELRHLARVALPPLPEQVQVQQVQGQKLALAWGRQQVC